MARNFLSKNLVYRNEDFKKRMKELMRLEDIARMRKPETNRSIVTESWRRIR